jgi:hypothetical protein
MSVRSYFRGFPPHAGTFSSMLLDDKTLCTQKESSTPALQKKITVTLNQYVQRKMVEKS